MMSNNHQLTSTHMQHLASDLNENAENRYALVLQIADVAKRLKDSGRERRRYESASLSNQDAEEKVIYQALMMKSSELGSGEELIG